MAIRFIQNAKYDYICYSCIALFYVTPSPESTISMRFQFYMLSTNAEKLVINIFLTSRLQHLRN